MKTNNYLSLCLEQAALSPLQYRHGCIVVRGGKVIGRGYNAHRHGFDGGALKTGRIASGSLDGPAIANLKRERRSKDKLDYKLKSDDAAPIKSFVPFKEVGGGHCANVPLSMHSEMMAIHSALARSSTLAVTAVSSVKPSFKLPGSSKRKTRLHREALKSYVELVFGAALEQQKGKNQFATERRESKSCVQDWHFEASASQPGQVAGGQEQQGRRQGAQAGQYRETPAEKQAKLSSDEPEEASVSERKSASEVDTQTFTATTKILRSDGSTSCEYSLKEHPVDDCNIFDSSHITPTQKAPDETKSLKTEPIIIPISRNKQHNNTVTERMRHSLLSGADVYVARFSNGRKLPGKEKRSAAECTECISKVKGTDDGASTSHSYTPTGSLHDELRNPYPHSNIRARTPDPDPFDWNTVHSSRPCYRCVSYMYSVGIKRVFWTNDDGQWEGAKVRDLVDALDMSGYTSAESGRKLIERGVFVTKHEVLIIRRLMENC